MLYWDTLNMFQPGEGKQRQYKELEKLTSEERKLYQHLREHNLRLEQEKILQSYAEERIFSVLYMVATLNNT